MFGIKRLMRRVSELESEKERLTFHIRELQERTSIPSPIDLSLSPWAQYQHRNALPATEILRRFNEIYEAAGMTRTFIPGQPEKYQLAEKDKK